LRCYVNYWQDNWVSLLPLAQFAYNSATNETTKYSPFYVNYGYKPQAYREPLADRTRAQTAITDATEIQDLWQQLSLDIQFFNHRMATYANRKRSVEPPLQKGDKVYLLRRNIDTKRPSDKLDFKKLGPFEIQEKLSTVNFLLKLPYDSRLHPVFHVSLLEPAPSSVPLSTGEEIQPINEDTEYDVDRILDVREVSTGTQYLIRWKGCDETEDSWEPTEGLNCPAKLQQFHRAQDRAQDQAQGRTSE